MTAAREDIPHKSDLTLALLGDFNVHSLVIGHTFFQLSFKLEAGSKFCSSSLHQERTRVIRMHVRNRVRTILVHLFDPSLHTNHPRCRFNPTNSPFCWLRRRKKERGKNVKHSTEHLLTFFTCQLSLSLFLTYLCTCVVKVKIKVKFFTLLQNDTFIYLINIYFYLCQTNYHLQIHLYTIEMS